MPASPRSKRKPAGDKAKYQSGDILVFKRDLEYVKGTERQYKIIFILEVWKVKKVHYRFLELMSWSGRERGWHKPEITEATEYKMINSWGGEWESIKEGEDLGFLAQFGSPAALVEDIVTGERFEGKLQCTIEQARKRLALLEERDQALQKAKQLLEERYVDIDTESI